MNKLKLVIKSLAFLGIFYIILSFFTLIYMPKRDCETSQCEQAVGIYQEPRNSLDVLFLGSCNMYSSVSPVLIYEEYGITGYAMCCPDQELSTSYYYLLEALKYQDIKVVVIESLFLTNTNNAKREKYNRFAVDNLPNSFNKLALEWNISKRESSFMKKYDPSSPDFLLTFAGYLFPLLRYHSRTDLDENDLALWQNQYNFYKGGFPQYNYTTNDGLFWDKVFNGDEINEISREYVPKIKHLCDENGIQLVIIKSPNYARWGHDDSYTQIVRDYVKELDIPFIDFHDDENNDFEEWDYGYETGRLNIYGVKKLSSKLGLYLSENCGLAPSNISSENKNAWDECVDKYYKVAEENNCSITPGEIAQVCNRDGAILVRWNTYDDCSSYSIYRCNGKNGKYEIIADHIESDHYLDSDVVSGKGYSYFVMPNEGNNVGKESETRYYVYIDMPKDFSVENENGMLHLEWKAVDEAQKYRLWRRTASAFNFEGYDVTSETEYSNYNVNEGGLYYYRLAAKYTEDGIDYYSMTTIVRAMPQKTPAISEISFSGGAVNLLWNVVNNKFTIQIFRRGDNEEDFRLIDTVSAIDSQYTDENVEKGRQYFYKIVVVNNLYDYTGVSDESNTVGVKVIE